MSHVSLGVSFSGSDGDATPAKRRKALSSLASRHKEFHQLKMKFLQEEHEEKKKILRQEYETKVFDREQKEKEYELVFENLNAMRNHYNEQLQSLLYFSVIYLRLLHRALSLFSKVVIA